MSKRSHLARGSWADLNSVRGQVRMQEEAAIERILEQRSEV